MAKVIVDTQAIVAPQWWSSGKEVIIGAGAGLVWWLAYILFSASITDNAGAAGGIAHIFVAILATLVLIRVVAARPLLVTVGTAALLWPLGGFLAGVSTGEGLLWVLVGFTASYLLFSVIARLRYIWSSFLVTFFILVVAYLVLSFS